MNIKVILQRGTYCLYLENDTFYRKNNGQLDVIFTINDAHKWLINCERNCDYFTTYPLIKEYMEALTIEAPELLN